MWKRCFDSNKAVSGADSGDYRRVRLDWRQDYTQNLDYGHLGLQHRNILLKVLSQANPHHLISIGNVVLCNKNAKSKLQEEVNAIFDIVCQVKDQLLHLITLSLLKKYPPALPRLTLEFSEWVGHRRPEPLGRPFHTSLSQIQGHHLPCRSL